MIMIIKEQSDKQYTYQNLLLQSSMNVF